MRVIRAEQLVRGPGENNAALERHCIHKTSCEIAGTVMEFCTDVPEVARLFSLRYGDHLTSQEPHFRYYVATIRGGYAFWCAHGSSWRWSQGPLPADAVLFLADSVALGSLIRFDAELASMHAAAIEYSGVAAAIAGSANGAKTTTLMACVRRGMRLYSDERTILRNGVVHPFLRRCSVRAAGARLLLSEGDVTRSDDALRTTPELSLRMCFGSDAIARPRPMRALFVLNGYGHCAALEAIDTSSALPSISRWFDSRGDMVDRVAHAIGALKSVKCYRLTLGSSDETAAAIAYAMTRIASA